MSSSPLLWLKNRRSIRKFSPQGVPEPLIEEILRTAAHAPSAHNLQPWRFARVQSPAARQTLGQTLTRHMQRDMQAENVPAAEIAARVSRSLRRIEEAPLILLLCRDTQAVRQPAPEEDLMAVQSVAMCGLQLMLAAQVNGLSTNWICWPLYAQTETSAALELPNTWQPQGMVFLGYAAEEPAPKTLQPLETLLKTL